jgi:hypothetical protein
MKITYYVKTIRANHALISIAVVLLYGLGLIIAPFALVIFLLFTGIRITLLSGILSLHHLFIHSPSLKPDIK